jgi:hypothetical protein
LGSLGGEHPFDLRTGGIALTFPGGDLGDQELAIAAATSISRCDK